MADHTFELASGRKIGISALGEPMATRMVVVCLPSLCAGPFDPVPELTVRSGLKVIQVDRPGYGASDPLPDEIPATVERFADDIAEYLHWTIGEAKKAISLDFGKVAAVGWSFGGVVAATLAARHPDLVDRLVIVAAPRPKRLRAGERYSPIAELRKHGVERTAESLRSSFDDDGHPMLAHLGIEDADPALEPLGVRGRVLRMLDAGWEQRSAGVVADRMAVRENGWDDEVGNASQPTLLVYGARDALATSQDAAWYERRLAATRHDSDSGGHLVIVDEWERILSFAGDPAS